MKKAIVLCSGGIDSVTTAYYAHKKRGYNQIVILFFNYGQRSLNRERVCSKRCAKNLKAKFIEIKLDWLAKISDSLINKSGKVRKLGRKDLKNTREESKNWYVPCRNTIFLVNALVLAESLKIKEKKNYDIFIGFKNEGKESFPDTTKEFVEQMNRLAKISTINKGKIIAPLIEKDKEDIILIGKEMGIDFRNTHSCYIKNKHCGYCLACMLRKEGFYWANKKDETCYG